MLYQGETLSLNWLNGALLNWYLMQAARSTSWTPKLLQFQSLNSR